MGEFYSIMLSERSWTHTQNYILDESIYRSLRTGKTKVKQKKNSELGLCLERGGVRTVCEGICRDMETDYIVKGVCVTHICSIV